MNDILQAVAVGIAILLALIWIIRRIMRKNDNACNCGCEGCSLSDKCRQEKK